MAKYEYSPLDSAGSQIRLLKLSFDVKDFLGFHNKNQPLSASLTHYYLPSASLPWAERVKRSARMPMFNALSYVWGDSTRSHEILIDGKPLPITANLYAALRDLQSDILDCKIWADAICINQEDFAERSAQIRLMRDIFHLAASVRVWLGPCTDETIRCAKFISLLDGMGSPGESTDEKPLAIVEAVAKAAIIPTAAIVHAGYGLGQTFVNIGDIIMPSYRDGEAVMILDPDSNFSLHQETIKKLVSWRPSARNLRRAQYEKDFNEMATLIDKVWLQKSNWFERMWVVQEVAVAENICLQIGDFALSWESFLRVSHYLYYVCKAHINNIGKVSVLEIIRLGWINGSRQPLRELLWSTRYRHATDPRDRVYSLLGLMGDPMNELLQPDYTKLVNEVYANTTLHIITQHSSLDPICGQQVQGRQSYLPSWVPDYSLNQDLAASPLVRIDGHESIYAASGYGAQSRILASDIFASSSSWDTLHVTGLRIDVVAHLSTPATGNENFSVLQNRWYFSLLEASGLLGGFTEDALQCLADISSVVSRYSDYFSSKGTPSNLTTGTQPDPLITEVYTLDGYIQTLLCGRISSGERITKHDIVALMRFQSPEESRAVAHQEFINKICSSFEGGMRRRRLAVTKEGYIGAVPQETELGDLICVLFGCSVPVVLRRDAMANTVMDEGSYKFIGEAYLHGFMDAEAIVMLVKGSRTAQNFTLR